MPEPQGSIKQTYGNKPPEEPQLPLWKQYAQKAFEGGFDTIAGLAGFPTNESKASQWGELIGAGAPLLGAAGKGLSLLKAGLPFSFLMKGKPGFHGTSKQFDLLDTTYNNKNDLLGAYNHIAVGPSYADDYASKFNKMTPGARIIPVVPEAKNVLDLYTPNMDDVAQIINQLDPYERATAIQKFKDFRKEGNPQWIGEHLARNTAIKDPSFLNETNFDAIRVKDFIHDTYAIPPTTPMRTPSGVPLNKAAIEQARPLKVIKK